MYMKTTFETIKIHKSKVRGVQRGRGCHGRFTLCRDVACREKMLSAQHGQIVLEVQYSYLTASVLAAINFSKVWEKNLMII